MTTTHTCYDLDSFKIKVTSISWNTQQSCEANKFTPKGFRVRWEIKKSKIPSIFLASSHLLYLSLLAWENFMCFASQNFWTFFRLLLFFNLKFPRVLMNLQLIEMRDGGGLKGGPLMAKSAMWKLLKQTVTAEASFVYCCPLLFAFLLLWKFCSSRMWRCSSIEEIIKRPKKCKRKCKLRRKNFMFRVFFLP